MGVPTRMEPPLTPGHEISGTVVEVREGVDPGLTGKPVLVPAVLPCGVCDFSCQTRNLCPSCQEPASCRKEVHAPEGQPALVPDRQARRDPALTGAATLARRRGPSRSPVP
jgi:threonine dehydrogenase-like Zn-dependent dehydrogenase